MNKPETPKTTTQKPQPKPLCHIHDKVNEALEGDTIRRDVCVNDEDFIKHTNGNYYCLFHLPSKEKNIEKFKKVFEYRIKEVESKIDEIEKLPEDDRDQAKQSVYHDFRYVWFPTSIDLSGKRIRVLAVFDASVFSSDCSFRKTIFENQTTFYSTEFRSDVSFHSAVFNDSAHFSNSKFNGLADFRVKRFPKEVTFKDAIFINTVKFNNVIFEDLVLFENAIFNIRADFAKTIFTKHTNFISAKFKSGADFSNATFEMKTNFDKTKFGKKGATDFSETKFNNDTFFDRARFRNYVSFNSAIFGKDSDVFFRGNLFAEKVNFRYCNSEGYLRFSKLRQGAENTFDFEEAAFEKASRVSFHTLKLCPNWFVNVDSRKFVFTDIDWQNIESDFRNKNIQAELDCLERRDITDQKKRLLKIAHDSLVLMPKKITATKKPPSFAILRWKPNGSKNLNTLVFRVI